MKETTRNRLAFDLYVRMGADRSLEALQETLAADLSLVGMKRAPSRSTIESWSSAFHWQDRLLDLERQATEQDRDQQLRELLEMNERHAREGLALQQKGVERLQSLPAEQMSPSDAVRSLIEGVRLERLARGEPTDQIIQRGEGSHGHIDLRKFTNEELRRLAELGDRRATGAGEEEPE